MAVETVSPKTGGRITKEYSLEFSSLITPHSTGSCTQSVRSHTSKHMARSATLRDPRHPGLLKEIRKP